MSDASSARSERQYVDLHEAAKRMVGVLNVLRNLADHEQMPTDLAETIRVHVDYALKGRVT